MNKFVNFISGVTFLLLFSTLAQANAPKEYILGTVGDSQAKVCTQLVTIDGNVAKPQPDVDCYQSGVNVFSSNLAGLEADSNPDTTAEEVLKDLPKYVNLLEAIYSIQRKISKVCTFTLSQNNDDENTKTLHVFFMDYEVGLYADEGGPRVRPDILDYIGLDSVDPEHQSEIALNYIFNTAKCDLAIAAQTLPDDNSDDDKVPVPPVTKTQE